MVGAGTPGGGLRKWQLAMQKVTAANAQESTVMTAGGRVERRKSLAGGGHLKGGIKGLLEAAKIQKAKEEAETEQKAAEEQQLALKNSVPLGWALGVFGPKNRMRIFLLKLVHHKVFERFDPSPRPGPRHGPRPRPRPAPRSRLEPNPNPNPNPHPNPDVK